MNKKIIITFGEMLKEEFLEPMNISQYRLAKSIGVSGTTINKLVNNKISLTSDMAYKFSLFFGNSFESWINLQAICDKQILKEKYKTHKLNIVPYSVKLKMG